MNSSLAPGVKDKVNAGELGNDVDERKKHSLSVATVWLDEGSWQNEEYTCPDGVANWVVI